MRYVSGEVKVRTSGTACLDTRHPWGMEATDGNTVFHVHEELLVEEITGRR